MKMQRVAIYFKLIEGKALEYEEAHKNIWPEMTEVLDMAGFRNYSIWRQDNMLFAYYEIKNLKCAEKILNDSQIYSQWRKLMENYIFIDPVTGQKEWVMKNVFIHE